MIHYLFYCTLRFILFYSTPWFISCSNFFLQNSWFTLIHRTLWPTRTESSSGPSIFSIGFWRSRKLASSWNEGWFFWNDEEDENNKYLRDESQKDKRQFREMAGFNPVRWNSVILCDSLSIVNIYNGYLFENWRLGIMRSVFVLTSFTKHVTHLPPNM